MDRRAPGHSAQGVVRPLLVVVDQPFVRDLLHLGRHLKEIGIEAPPPDTSVEAFDAGVLLGLAGLDAEACRRGGAYAGAPARACPGRGDARAPHRSIRTENREQAYGLNAI